METKTQIYIPPALQDSRKEVERIKVSTLPDFAQVVRCDPPPQIAKIVDEWGASRLSVGSGGSERDRLSESSAVQVLRHGLQLQ